MSRAKHTIRLSDCLDCTVRSWAMQRAPICGGMGHVVGMLTLVDRNVGKPGPKSPDRSGYLLLRHFRHGLGR